MVGEWDAAPLAGRRPEEEDHGHQSGAVQVRQGALGPEAPGAGVAPGEAGGGQRPLGVGARRAEGDLHAGGLGGTPVPPELTQGLPPPAHRRQEPGAPPADPPVPVATFYTANKLKGEAWGVELASDWQMLDCWRWRGGYTFYELSLEPTDGSADFNTVALLEGNAPRHQFFLRSQMDLANNVDFDIGLRYVDELDNPRIPAYTTVDAWVAWRPQPNLELSLVGLNLIEPAHPEFAATQVMTGQREVQRSVYGKITWRF